MADPPAWRTDYLGIHEEVWRKRRAEGEEGWSPAEVLADYLAFVRDSPRAGGILAGSRLLEIGCGEGRAAMALEQDGFVVHGVEIAPTAVGWAAASAARAGSRARFVRADGCSLPYRDGSFGAVLDGRCLHCIIGEDRTRWLAEARRVLRPGGVLLVLTMCGDRIPPTMREGFDPALRCAVVRGIAGRTIGLPEGILVEIRAAGFTVESWRVIEAPDCHDEPDDLGVLARRPLTGTSA